MNLRTVLLSLASLVSFSLVVSCASFGKQVESLDKISDVKKAYLILKVENKTGAVFLKSTRRQPSLWVSRAFTDASRAEGLAMVAKDDGKYLTYEVTPGTYRIDDFRMEDKGLYSPGPTAVYHLDRPFGNFFKVNPGEVVYLGTFTVTDQNEQRSDGYYYLPTTTEDYNLLDTKDEMIAKYPRLEDFLWVSILEDRPSF